MVELSLRALAGTVILAGACYFVYRMCNKTAGGEDYEIDETGRKSKIRHEGGI